VSFSVGRKLDLDIKTTPIPILEKSILSVTRNLLFEILIE
jgi:hypothetical protein